MCLYRRQLRADYGRHVILFCHTLTGIFVRWVCRRLCSMKLLRGRAGPAQADSRTQATSRELKPSTRATAVVRVARFRLKWFLNDGAP